MDPWVKYLLHICKDLSLDLQNSHKARHDSIHLYQVLLQDGRWKRAHPRELTGQLAWHPR